MTDALYYCCAPILQANGLSLHKLPPYIKTSTLDEQKLDSDGKMITIR